jgi:hypothetical protein
MCVCTYVLCRWLWRVGHELCSPCSTLSMSVYKCVYVCVCIAVCIYMCKHACVCLHARAAKYNCPLRVNQKYWSLLVSGSVNHQGTSMFNGNRCQQSMLVLSTFLSRHLKQTTASSNTGYRARTANCMSGSVTIFKGGRRGGLNTHLTELQRNQWVRA